MYYLVSYDIADKRRLSQIHKILVNWGLPLQKSVFVVIRVEGIEQLAQQLEKVMDVRVDDIRLYPLNNDSLVWKWENNTSLEGIILTGSPLN